MANELSLVARRIQEVRIAKKMSRQQLADKLTALRPDEPAVTYLQVYRYETGVTEVSVDIAAGCAEVLDVSVASLFRESRAAS